MRRDYSRLDAFLDKLRDDLYPEPPMQTHIGITDSMIGRIVDGGYIRKGMLVLDVGAGWGYAYKQLSSLGCIVTAFDIQPGQDSEGTDQSFMPGWDNQFDLVWARHVLEHSPMPYFTLTEYNRVLRPGGFCYVEVPAPDTAMVHENNPNHYSVMGRCMWDHLMRRAGFEHEKGWDIPFSVPQPDGRALDDVYLAFLLKKTEAN